MSLYLYGNVNSRITGCYGVFLIVIAVEFISNVTTELYCTVTIEIRHNTQHLFQFQKTMLSFLLLILNQD